MSAPADPVRQVPLSRLVRSELRWVLRRPRTQIALGLLAVVPVLMGIGIAVADSGGGPGLLTQAVGNGLALPVAALSVSLALLLLPLVVAMASADALAGESAHGTLRGLLLAPVSRARLVAVKAIGVLAVAVLAVTAVAGMGVVTGLVLVGWSGDGLLTLSGTEIGPWSALLRVGLAALWTVGQLAAIGGATLAVSSATDHPLVVLAAGLGGLIVCGVLTAIPSLDWLQPALLTTGWTAIADVLRDPLPLDRLATSTYCAACYLVIGLALALARTATREA